MVFSVDFMMQGYKSEDSVLLPAILGAALIGMILIITLCLVARNKRTIVATMKKRNRNVSHNYLPRPLSIKLTLSSLQGGKGKRRGQHYASHKWKCFRGRIGGEVCITTFNTNSTKINSEQI